MFVFLYMFRLSETNIVKMNENERSPDFSRMARVREVQSDSVPEVFCWCSDKALLSVMLDLASRRIGYFGVVTPCRAS